MRGSREPVAARRDAWVLGDPTPTGWSLVPTAWGRAALLHSPLGLHRLLLPERGEGVLRDRVQEIRGRSSPPVRLPAGLRPLGRAMRAYFAGEAVDPAGLPVPLVVRDLTPFARSVYAALRRVGRGRRLTYGTLAALAGSPRAARAVGRLMAANRFPLIVPCHRVLPGRGGPGGFSAPGGAAVKEALLALEGGGAEHAMRGTPAGSS